MIYSILFWGLFIAGLNEVVKTKTIHYKIKQVPLILAMMILVFFAGLRASNIGLDTMTYRRIFLEIQENPISILHSFRYYNIEYGYALLNILAPGFQWLLFITAIFGVGLKIYISNQLNVKKKAAFLLFYFSSIYVFYDMGIIREGLAISVIFLALPSIKNRNLKKFCFYLLIAMLFHITAILVLPLYFVGNKEFSRKVYYFILLLTIGVTLFVNVATILRWVADFLKNDYITHKLDVYFAQSIYTQIHLSSFIKRIVLLIVFLEIFKHKRLKFGSSRIAIEKREQTEYTWLYINAYYISVLEMILLSFMPIMGTRGTAYLYSCQYFLFCEIINDKRKNILNIIYYLLFALLSYYSLKNTLHHSFGNLYVPYQMFLS